MALHSPPGTSGTTFTGSIAATQVAFGSGANAFAGSANLTYDNTNLLLSIGSGSTTSAGVQAGYSGSSGLSGVWRTGVVASSANAIVLTDASQNVTIGGNVSTIQLFPQNSANNANGVSISAGSIFSAVNAQVSLGKSTNLWTKLYLDYTNTATVGPVTINKAGGKVNLAALGTSLTLTNSVITVNSRLILTLASNPGNAVAVALSYVPSAGSAIITATPAVTNQTIIDFTVINAD